MAIDYEKWLKDRGMSVGMSGEAPAGRSPTFMPKYKSAAEAAAAQGQTDFTPEPYVYKEPPVTVKRTMDFSKIGMTPDEALGFPPYQAAKKAVGPVIAELSKTPSQRGAEYQAQYNRAMGISPASTASVPASSVPSSYAPKVATQQMGPQYGQQGLLPGEFRVYDPRSGTNIQGNAEQTVRGMDQLQQANPYLRGSSTMKVGSYSPEQAIEIAKKNYEDWKAKSAAPAKERLTPVTPTIKQAFAERQYAQQAPERQAERGLQVARIQAEKEGMIGKAQAEQQGRENIAKIESGARQPSGAEIDIKKIEALSSALAASENPEDRKRLAASIMALVGGGQAGNAKLPTNQEMQRAEAMDVPARKEAIKKANPGKTDAELAGIYKKYGIV